jgi:hypothetical protein
MAVSDVLYEAEIQIAEYQDAGIIAQHGDPELELVKAVMRAVRLQPGRDAPPHAPDRFREQLAEALTQYDNRRR